MTRGLKISVAICTWNRCELLANALDRLAGGAQPPRVPWEVLVVNNACSDDTSTVVASFAERLPIQEMFEPEPGLSHARNRALHESTGTHVAFIDDDVFVEEGWLVAFADLAGRYPEAAVFAGPVQAYFPVTPDPDVVAAFPYLRRGFCGLDHEQSEGPLPGGLLPAGANMAFRKAALDGLRFEARLGAKRDEGYGHEDVEFVRRVLARGGSAVWSPQFRVQHYVDPARMSPAYLVRFERDRARSRIRASRRPSGPNIFGVPLPVLAGYVVAHTVCGFWRLLPVRRPKLVWMAKSQRFTGKVQEYLAKRYENP